MRQLLDLVVADYALRGRRSSRRMEIARARLLDEFGPDHAVQVTLARLEAYLVERRHDAAPATAQ